MSQFKKIVKAVKENGENNLLLKELKRQLKFNHPTGEKAEKIKSIRMRGEIEHQLLQQSQGKRYKEMLELFEKEIEDLNKRYIKEEINILKTKLT